MTQSRPRAETCQRLTLADLRPLVEPGTTYHQLADGTELRLGWSEVRGCWGRKQGQALLMYCPGCDAACRVLRRPPEGCWLCWRCQPISHRSHRRPGSRRGRPKPVRWRLDQITAEQSRIVALLGLASWPPQRLLWSWRTLPLEARRPDAPRLSPEREQALHWRLDALESLRLEALLPSIDADLRKLGQALPEWPELKHRAAGFQRILAATAWAMRRPARDPRTGRQQRPKPIAPQ